MAGLYAGIILIGLLVVVGVFLFNRLIQRRQMVKNGWADIDVQLKRRANLIPNLVETVQGFASHERTLFTDVVEARSAALAAGDDPASRGAAETALSAPLARILAISEAYPDLKSSENFLSLQAELSDTETKIEMARRFYNGAVRELNTAIESVPTNLIAGMFGFQLRDYFEIDIAERALPNIDLGDK